MYVEILCYIKYFNISFETNLNMRIEITRYVIKYLNNHLSIICTDKFQYSQRDSVRSSYFLAFCNSYIYFQINFKFYQYETFMYHNYGSFIINIKAFQCETCLITRILPRITIGTENINIYIFIVSLNFINTSFQKWFIHHWTITIPQTFNWRK